MSAEPQHYNAAHDLIQRNLQAGRAGRIAYIDDHGSYSYGDLAERVNRVGNVLVGMGLHAGNRVMLCLLDGIDFPTAFLGCIQAGIIPIAVNTLLTTSDYDFMLGDSQVKALLVSKALWPQFAPIVAKHRTLRHVIISGGEGDGPPRLSELMADVSPHLAPAPTSGDDFCFWYYSSGSTGAPKGVVHRHSSLIQTAELYAKPILGMGPDDLVFSAAKLCFAYGLGNGLCFPLAVGATTVLMAERPTPQAVLQRLRQHRPTIFFAVPTLYAALLASPGMLTRTEVGRLRISVSAGEALPADIGRRWSERLGIDVLDGIGSTEMLHIFLSNRPGEVRYGTTGKPVPGYAICLIGEDGQPAPPGEIGELRIKGPSAAVLYWNDPGKSRHTFIGDWVRSDDKFVETTDGYFRYCGRSDDMLKVGGLLVSPFEVEAALISHVSVQEAAVVAHADADDLIKPKAYVVLKAGVEPSDALGEALKQHVKGKMARYKFPRWIEFVAELPKTTTGKIQRFKLR